MNAFWSFFWPIFGLGVVAGVIGGVAAFRRLPDVKFAPYAARRNKVLGAVAVGCVVAALLWTGPLGGADRFVAQVDREVRDALVYNEMTAVHVHLHQGPLTRRVALAGPADDFQRGALAEALAALPGIEGADWSGGGGGLPLVVEAVIAALLGFGIGLVPAYVVELRRRYNAQWSW